MHGLPRILEDGTIVYPHKGKTPPPCLEGYKRKCEYGPDAWVLIPLWRQCIFRIQVLQKREDCQCQVFVSQCNHHSQPNLILSVKICEDCKLCQIK
jgi:hypothetical protein